MLPALAAIVLLLAAAPAGHAAFPGANGRIAYSATGAGDANGDHTPNFIFTLTPAGTRARSPRSCVAGEPGCVLNAAPAYSPDGRWIAFAAGPRLAVMREDGTEARELPPLTGYDSAPTWSPDGRHLAFAGRRRSEGRPDVFRVRADGRGLKRLTTRGGAAPVWSVKGEIAYERCPKAGTSRGCSLRVMRRDGDADRRVLARAGAPAWSPDGRRLAVARFRGWVKDGWTNRPAHELWAVRRDGRRARRIAEDGFNPAWSPDGRRIAFQYRETAFDAFLATMRLDGTGLRVIASVGFRSGFTSRPDWQPLPRRRVARASPRPPPRSRP